MVALGRLGETSTDACLHLLGGLLSGLELDGELGTLEQTLQPAQDLRVSQG